jgi:hypothetical protein
MYDPSFVKMKCDPLVEVDIKTGEALKTFFQFLLHPPLLLLHAVTVLAFQPLLDLSLRLSLSI